MSDCSQDLQIKHAELLATLTSEMNNVKNILMNLGTISDTLVELKLLTKQNIEFNKQQVESNREFKETLSAIDSNLSKLNNQQSLLTERVGKIESEDVQNSIVKQEEKIEDKRLFVERYKANLTFWGVILSCLFSLFAVFSK